MTYDSFDKLLKRFNMLLLILVFAIVTQGQFTLACNPRDQCVEGVEGESLTISCPDSGNAKTRWKGPLKQFVISSNGVYSIKQINDESTLTIKDLNRLRDDGKFTCEWGYQRNTSFTVTVLAKIQEAVISGGSVDPGRINISDGTYVNLTCSITGNPLPDPKYKWMIDEQGKVEGQYFTLNADRSADGKYLTCRAYNTYRNGTVLSSKTSRAILNILYLDRPSVTHRNVTVSENERVTLRCSAEGNPPPSYQWRRSGSSEVISTLANYTIENVQRSAAGNYTCKVYNSIQSYQTIRIIHVDAENSTESSSDASGNMKKLYLILGPVVAVSFFIIVVITEMLLYRRSKRGAEPDKSPSAETQSESATVHISGQNGVDEFDYDSCENPACVTESNEEEERIYEEIPMVDNFYERLNTDQDNQTPDLSYVTMTTDVAPHGGNQDVTCSRKPAVQTTSYEKPIKTKCKDRPTVQYDNHNSLYDEGYEYVSSKPPVQ